MNIILLFPLLVKLHIGFSESVKKYYGAAERNQNIFFVFCQYIVDVKASEKVEIKKENIF